MLLMFGVKSKPIERKAKSKIFYKDRLVSMSDRITDIRKDLTIFLERSKLRSEKSLEKNIIIKGHNLETCIKIKDFIETYFKNK